MRRFGKRIIIIIGLVLISYIGFKGFSAKLVKEATELNDSYVSISMVAVELMRDIVRWDQ